MFLSEKINNQLANGETLFLGWYFPARQKDLHKDNWTRVLLDVKQNEPNTVKSVASFLQKLLADDVVLVPLPCSSIPLSDSQSLCSPKENNGIVSIISHLSAAKPEQIGTNILVRRYPEGEEHSQGKYTSAEKRKIEGLDVASFDVQLRSIHVGVPPEHVKDKKILLLTDVTTTGLALKAARARLLSAGAKTVCSLSLGLSCCELELCYPNSTPAQVALTEEVRKVSPFLGANWQRAGQEYQRISVKKSEEFINELIAKKRKAATPSPTPVPAKKRYIQTIFKLPTLALSIEENKENIRMSFPSNSG